MAEDTAALVETVRKGLALGCFKAYSDDDEWLGTCAEQGRELCSPCAADAALDALAQRLADMTTEYLALSQTYRDALARANRAEAALRSVVNHLGPQHFGGDLEGLIEEGNEALRIARAALTPTEEPEWQSVSRIPIEEPEHGTS